MPKGVYSREGLSPWNKGLTKDDPRVSSASEKRKSTLLERYGTTSYNNSKKRKATCVERYGVDNVAKLPEVANSQDRLNKITKTCLDRYGVIRASQLQEVKDKMHRTFLQRYGVSSVSQLPGVGEKISKSRSSKESIRKAEETCIERYGVPYVMMLKSVQDKVRQTCIDRYGVPVFPNKEKEYQTKKSNGTLGSHKSKIEIYYEEMLIHEFGKDSVIYNYFSEEYPFKADFYIVQKDLFIEINAHWTHGPHPYDSENPDDVQLVMNWMELAETKPYYMNAIYVWTDLDVRKREIAIENNLNYIAIYPKESGDDIVFSHAKA